MKRAILLITFLAFSVLGARDIGSSAGVKSTKDSKKQKFNITVGNVWNYMSNFGSLGGDFNNNDYGYDWPGGNGHPYYLWGSYFTIGFKVGDNVYVTAHNYPDGEWNYTSDYNSVAGPRESAWDVFTSINDYRSNPKNTPGRHSGIKVIIHTLAWPHYPYNNFIAHEIYITYDPNECDIGSSPPAQLDSLFLGMWYDCDVCGSDPSDPHIDDFVSFDGWTNGEWNDPTFRHRSPVDSFTVLPDTFLAEPDGIPDQYLIWGDEDKEHIIDSAAAWTIVRNDTDTVRGYLIPRGISYIYDGDNPADPGNDVGEDGSCAGYIGGTWLYAPPSPADTTWVVNGDTCRIVRPWSHQWWNWESDPATDEDIYNYLKGHHRATYMNGHYYRYAPHPEDLHASVFDYRFLSTVGPYTLRPGDTLKFVWIVGVGQGLNGGDDQYWGRGWVIGLRQVMEAAMKAYYAGSEHSDPAHPSAPDEDRHWNIPVPPAAPGLRYSYTKRGVELIWDDYAERTPDPIKGVVDVVAYRVYRSVFAPSNWQLIAEFSQDSAGGFAHSYVDTTVSVGFPYYYVVVAVDDDSLESPRNNYKKDEDGNPVALVIGTQPASSIENVKVVPNPYKGSAPWTASEIADKVEFINLPPQAVIRIYTLSGDLVKTIVHNSSTDGSESWNLLTRSGQKVVTGVYIYKVETPDGKYKIGKFLILK